MSSHLTCPKCAGNDIRVQVVTDVKTKNRGCFRWMLWILLAVLTVGLILIIPLLTNTKSKTKHRTLAVCQSCGYQWTLR